MSVFCQYAPDEPIPMGTAISSVISLPAKAHLHYIEKLVEQFKPILRDTDYAVGIATGIHSLLISDQVNQ
jgi:hypothetical protein